MKFELDLTHAKLYFLTHFAVPSVSPAALRFNIGVNKV